MAQIILTEKTFGEECLVNYFKEACKPLSDFKVGTEFEKLGVYGASGEAIPYYGEKGVESILKSLAEKEGYTASYSGRHITALSKEGCSVTLEPGGQIELSGHAFSSLSETAAQLDRHLASVKRFSDSLGIVWLGLGCQPLSPVDTIEWVPKARYGIMDEYFKTKGKLAHSMMKKTAAIQTCLDFTDEEDAVLKFRTAMGISPLLTALYANSPLSDGKPTGFLSERAHIWTEVDSERCGFIRKVFESDFGFQGYVDFALNVPMFFIVRQQQWIPMKGKTFREFLKEGLEHYKATWADWELHLTSIFTEVRLKRYIEVRGTDCQNRHLSLTVPALMKGLLYYKDSCQKAWKLVESWSFEERIQLWHEAALKGLEAKIRGKKVLDYVQELVAFAEEGLRHSHPDDLSYLLPLKELVFEVKKSPAQLLLDNWQGSWKQDIQKLIQHTAL